MYARADEGRSKPGDAKASRCRPASSHSRGPAELYDRSAEHRVEGDVWVEAVVLPDGTVWEACVRRSLHADLDVEALAAARRWLFAPGRREDQPVPVLVTIELSFSLKR
jgi:TonB family protein